MVNLVSNDLSQFKYDRYIPKYSFTLCEELLQHYSYGINENNKIHIPFLHVTGMLMDSCS